MIPQINMTNIIFISNFHLSLLFFNINNSFFNIHNQVFNIHYFVNEFTNSHSVVLSSIS